MFRIFKAKEKKRLTYDRETQKPVIRCSICTGEQVAGFKDIHTGKFDEVMLIRGEKDLEMFCRMYGVADVTSALSETKRICRSLRKCTG